MSRIPFRYRLYGVWAFLLLLFVGFFYTFDLDLGLIVGRVPSLLGLTLTRTGALQGAALTLFLSISSMAISTVLAFLTAMGRLSRRALPYGVATFYTSFFRGTPFLLQILLIYVGLPQVGVVPSALFAGIAALSLNGGAYFSETIRAGLLSVPVGQREAGMSLGLPRHVIFRKIVLPQAMRVILPPAASQFISLLKDSSLVSIMGLWEIMYLSQAYGKTTYHFMEMLLAASAIYWAMSLVVEVLQFRIETSLARGFQRLRSA